jgi:hypothetical protein
MVDVTEVSGAGPRTRRLMIGGPLHGEQLLIPVNDAEIRVTERRPDFASGHSAVRVGRYQLAESREPIMRWRGWDK